MGDQKPSPSPSGEKRRCITRQPAQSSTVARNRQSHSRQNEGVLRGTIPLTHAGKNMHFISDKNSRRTNPPTRPRYQIRARACRRRSWPRRARPRAAWPSTWRRCRTPRRQRRTKVRGCWHRRRRHHLHRQRRTQVRG